MKKGDYIAVGQEQTAINNIRIFLRLEPNGTYVCVYAGSEEGYRSGGKYDEYVWGHAKEMKEFGNAQRKEHFVKGELVAVWNEGDQMKTPAVYREHKKDTTTLNSCYVFNNFGCEAYKFCEKIDDPKNHDWRVKNENTV